ncbi:hypothetical protein [Pelagicoccus mobilis]|uniref:Glycoside hydrolase family 5 domain-containing protein n=1 Tax=Pelagicoccus mobilis TaxID=415221 RepID=A0A934S314_9BACT|nr:hypothetical protein [Pelagicoccus mobilis]MBK1879736.1 hypothetical protein [Pelagicoccus mobilis]
MTSSTLNKLWLNIVPRKAALGLVLMALLAVSGFAADWSFEPERDAFDEAALFDLRYLNEDTAGEAGWISYDEEGDFVKGNGESIRFWAVNTNVGRGNPEAWSQPGWQNQENLDHHARWLAKRGVNLIRLHSHINPSDSAPSITDVNAGELDWIWSTVGAMREEGIYSVVSPYWARNMKSGGYNEPWGHLFFDEALQDAYKEWLRKLFTTPTPHLGGKTLAEEPSLAIFQIQNEDSLLFWTVDRMPSESKAALGKLFYTWAVDKYGSLENVLAEWGENSMPSSDTVGLDDDLDQEMFGLAGIWYLKGEGRVSTGESSRMNDQLQFFVETMIDFNKEIARFVREDLNCPVLVNAGNWKTADVVYLQDSERYSYAESSDVVALNRYFSGVHVNPTNKWDAGWAVQNGDYYTTTSVLDDGILSLPISVKQPAGKPMMVTESTWVMPMDTAFEGPMLISAYSSLSGFDAYFWFVGKTEGFAPPRSANGYKPSQEKWVFMNPEMAGQFPAAALAFRSGYIQKGDTVLEEHRSLESMWDRRSPVIAESASFDPNRDSGNLPPESNLDGGVDPHAFLVGPVEVHFDSSEANTELVDDFDGYVEALDSGVRVTSITDELILSTAERTFTIDSPKVQTLICYEPVSKNLGSVSYEVKVGACSITTISLDSKAIGNSSKVLVQMASPSRPTNWESVATDFTSEGNTYSGYEITNYGQAPWVMKSTDVRVSVDNRRIYEAHALDANGMPVGEVVLTEESGGVSFDFPEGSLYVVLLATPGVAYDEWKNDIPWGGLGSGPLDDPDGDGNNNLVEFVSDLSPLVFEPNAMGTVAYSKSSEGIAVSMEFRQSQLTSGVLDVFEGSEDLVTWQPLNEIDDEPKFEIVDEDPDGDGSATLSRLKMNISLEDPRLFLRRKVSLPSGDS